MSFVYRKSEPQLWTVGVYLPDGTYEPESDHESPEDAAARVHYLNGGDEPENPDILHGDKLAREFAGRG